MIKTGIYNIPLNTNYPENYCSIIRDGIIRLNNLLSFFDANEYNKLLCLNKYMLKKIKPLIDQQDCIEKKYTDIENNIEYLTEQIDFIYTYTPKPHDAEITLINKEISYYSKLTENNYSLADNNL